MGVMPKVEREGRCRACGANHAELEQGVREWRHVGERDKRSTVPDGLKGVWIPACRVRQPEGEVVVLAGDSRNMLTQSADPSNRTTKQPDSA